METIRLVALNPLTVWVIFVKIESMFELEVRLMKTDITKREMGSATHQSQQTPKWVVPLLRPADIPDNMSNVAGGVDRVDNAAKNAVRRRCFSPPIRYEHAGRGPSHATRLLTKTNPRDGLVKAAVDTFSGR